MPDTELAAAQERLERLREHYLKSLPETFQRLSELIRALPADQPGALVTGELDAALRELSGNAHKLIGSAGSLGLSTVSAAATQLESLAVHWHDHTLSAQTKRRIMLQLICLMESCEPELEAPKFPPLVLTNRKIHIVEDDELVGHQLLSWLLEAGYDASLFQSSSIYMDTFEDNDLPDLIIMDVAFGNDPTAGPSVVRGLRARLGHLPVVVFMSVHDNMEARLAALRAGASRYLVKPINRQRLLTLADEFTEPKSNRPYQILMVDDDPTALSYARSLFEPSGIVVHATTEPLKAVGMARKVSPDVILLDVMMPEVTGVELLAVIREDPDFDPIPIIFLTSLDAPEQRVISASLGGDDYLEKTADPDLIVTTVMARAKRSRRLRRRLRP